MKIKFLQTAVLKLLKAVNMKMTERSSFVFIILKLKIIL